MTVGDRLRYFDLTFAARRNPYGKINGVMVLGLEVTEKVLTRQKMESYQVWLETVLNKLPLPLFLIDARLASVHFSNDAAKKMLGFALDEFDPKTQDLSDRLRFLQSDEKPCPDSIGPLARAARGSGLKMRSIY